MRVHVCAVGRLRGGPEREMLDDYLSRFEKVGRGQSLGPATLHEVEDKKGGGPSAEAALLLKAIPSGALICTMDERGTVMTSPNFANTLAKWRDNGRQDAAFVIGGADGLTPELRKQADASLSFGTMVWPHMLARIMLSEQLYRAASILAGTPYHRA